MENVVDTPDISEFIIFVKKFADLVCVEFRHDDMEHWDVFSNKFRFSPNEKVEDGFFPVRAIIDSNGHVKLKVLNFIAREADWKIQRTEAEVIIRSLSYYGHRHKFCPGLFILTFVLVMSDIMRDIVKIFFYLPPLFNRNIFSF
jgi:hypothetical protein